MGRSQTAVRKILHSAHAKLVSYAYGPAAHLRQSVRAARSGMPAGGSRTMSRASLPRARALRLHDAGWRASTSLIAMTAAQHVVEERRWGASCLAYNLQIDASAEAVDALVQLQQQLVRACDVPMHLTPAPSLHVSVYAIVPFHWHAPDKEAYWRRLAPTCLSALRALCATTAPTALCFSELRVTPQAVIVTARDETGLLKALRERLRSLTDPAVPTPAYDLVHTTVARFAVSTELPDDMLRGMRALPVWFPLEVTGVHVVRERVYPSLVLDSIARLPLLGTPRAGG